MLFAEPVKIPDLPGKITFAERNGDDYVRYLAGRTYNAEKKYNVPEWVFIGRRIEEMPGLMYPNENYERLFRGKGEKMENENMTAEEEEYVRDHGVYEMYHPFFLALYFEFRAQTKSRGDEKVNPYKAENINQVLRPLKELMKHEVYGDMLHLINEGGEEEMTYTDAMILMTKYKSALAKYSRKRFI